MRSTPPRIKAGSFPRRHSSLQRVLLDKELARLGDAYINLVYSLAESHRTGKGTNSRAPAKVLAESLKRAGLRGLLPKRTPAHDQADAVEALAAYAWLTNAMSLEECVSLLLGEEKDEAELFTGLIEEAVKRLGPSFGEPSKVQGDQT